MSINYWHKFLPNQYYHIYNHAAGEKNFFNSEVDYKDFLSKYDRYFSNIFQTVAFCLMPNHFHFLVRAEDFMSLASSEITEEDEKYDQHVVDLFRRFFSSYALAYNFRNQTRGQLFLKKCKRVAVEGVRLPELICYIHHNPIHHRFKLRYEDWKFSSYSSNILERGRARQFSEYFGSAKGFDVAHEKYQANWIEKLE